MSENTGVLTDLFNKIIESQVLEAAQLPSLTTVLVISLIVLIIGLSYYGKGKLLMVLASAVICVLCLYKADSLGTNCSLAESQYIDEIERIVYDVIIPESFKNGCTLESKDEICLSLMTEVDTIQELVSSEELSYSFLKEDSVESIREALSDARDSFVK